MVRKATAGQSPAAATTVGALYPKQVKEGK